MQLRITSIVAIYITIFCQCNTNKKKLDAKTENNIRENIFYFYEKSHDKRELTTTVYANYYITKDNLINGIYFMSYYNKVLRRKDSFHFIGIHYELKPKVSDLDSLYCLANKILQSGYYISEVYYKEHKVSMHIDGLSLSCMHSTISSDKIYTNLEKYTTDTIYNVNCE